VSNAIKTIFEELFKYIAQSIYKQNIVRPTL